MALPLPAIAMGVGALAGGIQSLIGAGQAKRANRNLKRLFSQRKAYQTPEEIFEILQLTQSNASQGFSDETLQVLEGNAGRGLSATLGSATRSGADPNQLSGVLDNYFQNIFKTGTENELVKMKKFDDFTNALRTVADNRAAEWQSQENLIKDQMQAEAQKVGAGQANLQSGLNLAFGSIAALAGSGLFNEKDPPVGGGNPGVRTSAYTATTVPQRRLDLTSSSPAANIVI